MTVSYETSVSTQRGERFTVSTTMRMRVRTTKLWSAVTCHRFRRLADKSAKQSRVQRLAEKLECLPVFDGDKSPAESADKSAHSKPVRHELCGSYGFDRLRRSRRLALPLRRL